MNADSTLPFPPAASSVNPVLANGLLDRLKAQRSDRLRVFVQPNSPQPSLLVSPPDETCQSDHHAYDAVSIPDARRSLQETPSLPFSAHLLPHTRSVSPLPPASYITDHVAIPSQQHSPIPDSVRSKAQMIVEMSDLDISASCADDRVLMEVSGASVE